jgi:hypothetical protein
MKKFLFTALIIISLASCTDNKMARTYGGTETIDLPPGERLVTATWKSSDAGADIWFLTEPMPADYVPQTKHFRESSNYGVWEGTVIFKESR